MDGEDGIRPESEHHNKQVHATTHIQEARAENKEPKREGQYLPNTHTRITEKLLNKEKLNLTCRLSRMTFPISFPRSEEVPFKEGQRKRIRPDMDPHPCSN